MKSLNDIESSVIADKLHGLSDVEIGKKYKITYRQLEKILRKAFGVSISSVKTQKTIKSFEPKDFKEETTTVWSFKNRGIWATHSSEYRGNWSPYIPRNVILKYSKPGDIVLDYFCGAGTTAVEAKILGRRAIAFDINEKAIELARKNLSFSIPEDQMKYLKIYEPELFVGDARNLSFIPDDSIDLICAHPPYANIIHYTNQKEGDLSFLELEDYLNEMKKVAIESFRALKRGRKCAILIGDMRKNKNVIPLGFMVIDVFLNAGFKLKELVIKRQHNCKTTGFWYKNSIKYNFLLLAHEYLPIFEKPEIEIAVKKTPESYFNLNWQYKKFLQNRVLNQFETTTVWLFPEREFSSLLEKNVIERYQKGNSFKIIEIGFETKQENSVNSRDKFNLLFIRSKFPKYEISSKEIVSEYLAILKEVLSVNLEKLNPDGYCVIETKDIRINGYIEPMAKNIVDFLRHSELSLKEIIVVTTESQKNENKQLSKELKIVHQYLLVFQFSRLKAISKKKNERDRKIN